MLERPISRKAEKAKRKRTNGDKGFEDYFAKKKLQYIQKSHVCGFFAKALEENRKDVKRAFGVLQARFAIMHGPASFFYGEMLQDIIKYA